MTNTKPSNKEPKPSKLISKIMAAQAAMGTGFFKTTPQLSNTACHSEMRRSSKSGMVMTLEAKMGAAITPPSASHISNSQPSLAPTTRRKKSTGVWIGMGESSVISAAEVSTQPVDASASSKPNCTMHQ
jgi:hypothetical protein